MSALFPNLLDQKPKDLPVWIILDIWALSSFTSVDILLSKVFLTLFVWLVVKNNLCGNSLSSKLVDQNGFYPYEDMRNFEKLMEELPIKQNFYNLLTDRKNSDKEYEQVLNDWEKTELKTTNDYHELSLKCDILLLADAFEKFRNNSLKNYGLCPSHYLSAPGLSWDAILKMKKIVS